jgi:hypothetical protein
MHTKPSDNLPWYKQFWPWFLIFLPLSVVIASVITFFIAQNNPPSLVSGDYYKDGLAINANKKLEANAKKLGLSAIITNDNSTFTVQLNGLKEQPPVLFIELRHSTISQHDQSFSLTKVANGIYQSPFVLPQQGKWYVSIHAPNGEWEIKKVSYLKTP